MGILDQTDDPQTQGILRAAFALLKASGASKTPVSIGEALGSAGEAGMQGYQAAEDANLARKIKRQQLAQAEAETAMRSGILDMNDPDSLRRYGMATKKPEFITHAERIEKKREQAADLENMKSQQVVVPPSEADVASAAGHGAPLPEPKVARRGGIFGSLATSEFADIAAEAKARQTEVDTAKVRDPETIRKERDRLLGIVENRLKSEDAGNSKVVRDPSSSTGWSYKNLRTGVITSKDAPPPSNAPSLGTTVIPAEHAHLRGQEYLDTLPSGMASLVKSVAEGRVDPAKAASMRYGNREALMERVMQYDPQYNAARHAVWKDFTSGKTAQNVTAMNTVISHMGTVSDLSEALKNKDVQRVNALVNRIRRETGKDEINNAEIAIEAMGNELMRVFRQVGASTHEIESWKSKFDAAKASPAQLRGALKVGAELLQGRIDAVDDQWKRGMNTTEGFPNLLSQKSREALERINGKVGAKQAPSEEKRQQLRDKYLKTSQVGEDYEPPARGSPKGRVGGGTRLQEETA